MDSLSMTPPQSPFGFSLEDLNPSPPNIQQFEDDKFTCFNCLGEVSPRTQEFHAEGYWMSKYMSRIFWRDVSWQCTNASTVEMFSHCWQKKKMFTEHLDKIFLLIRQNIGEIQSYTNSNSMFIESSVGCDLMVKRQNIVECLEIIWRYVHKGNGLSNDRLEDLVGKLHVMLLYIGRLTDLPSHVTMTTACHQGNRTSGGVYHSFHLHLDVYWRILMILYTIEKTFPDFRYTKTVVQSLEPDLDLCLFDQIVQLILWDLVALACQRFVHKVPNGDYTKVGMFSCTCIREMWLLVLKLLEIRSHKHGGQSFWISLHQVLVILLQDKEGETEMDLDLDSDIFINPPVLPVCKEPAGLCLWIISNVAPLFKLQSGDPEMETRLQSNYHDVEKLLKKSLDQHLVNGHLFMDLQVLNNDISLFGKWRRLIYAFSQPSMTEAKLRLHLKTCLQLSSLWEPNTAILVILWEYYYRRLNNTFQLNSVGVEGLASIHQTVSGLYHQCKKFVSEQPGTEQETSFQLFLRLLALHLGRLFTEGSLQEWKQMKGRFYSKFHQRRIQNLSEGGLYNLTSLFLTITMVTDVEDVGSKLCDFYDMLDISKISFGKRSVVWCGAFTLMLIHTEKQIDVGFLADKMSSAMDNAVSEFASQNLDNHHSLWKLILLYLEGTQEIFDTSQGLQLSEHKLLCPAVKSLLSACSESELRTTLSILHSIVYRFNEVLEKREIYLQGNTPRQHIDLTDAVWNNIYPFVRDHSMTLTPPPQLADLVAGICFMALKFSGREKIHFRENLLSVFQHFAAGENVNVNISCRFLGHVLPSGEVKERLEKDLPNYQTLIVKAWFRCVLQIPDSSQILTEVTRSVIQLEDVRSVFISAETEIPTNLDIIPVQFLKAVEKAQKKMQTWKDRMEFRDRVMNYFSDVSKQVAMVIKNQGPPEVLSNTYKMSGYLVKYCALILFVESKPDCPLPNLINTMIVPYHVFNPDKPLQTGFLASVRDTLHLFIQGLAKLDYKKSPYVQRRLKDIITVYLPKFPLKSSSVMSVATSVHPIVASLSSSFTQHTGEEAVKFRHYLLQLVIDNFVVVKNMAVHPAHAVGISFMHEVVQRTTNTEVLARDATLVLPWCLEYLLLLSDTSSSLVTVTHVLQATMEACVLHSQSSTVSNLSSACTSFIQRFFKFSSEGTIRAMEKLAVLHRDLVISVIKKLSDSVKELEAKRGVGIDKRLRHIYYRLLKLLGPTGEAEIQILQAEDT